MVRKKRVLGSLLVSASLISLSLLASAVQNCASDSIHCIGTGEEFDTSNNGLETALQSATSTLSPGDRIVVRGGNYQHNILSPRNTLWSINRSGTAQQPIVIEPYDGEAVTFSGFGFVEGTQGPQRTDERLIHVTGDHVHLKGIEIRNSSRFGLVIEGRYGLYEDLSVHDSWESNILVYGNTRDITDNTLRRIESYRSRHGSGIWVLPSSGSGAIVANTTIEDSFLYMNGYQPDGNKVPPVNGDSAGGGNSDGLGIFKGCLEDAYLSGVSNLCPGNLVERSVFWHNADDGADTSAADGTRIVDNISFDNGPEGNRAYKTYVQAPGSLDFIGNVGAGQNGLVFETRFENDGGLFHNTSVSNNSSSFVSIAYGNNPQIYVANNLAAFNNAGTSFDLRTAGGSSPYTVWTNWSDDSSQSNDPHLASGHFDVAEIDTNFDPSLSVAEKLAFIRDQFREHLTPVAGSPLVDAGTVVEGIHCARADDDANSPMNPSADCRHWVGAAPDIGAFEYGLVESSAPGDEEPTTPRELASLNLSIVNQAVVATLGLQPTEQGIYGAEAICHAEGNDIPVLFSRYEGFFGSENVLEIPMSVNDETNTITAATSLSGSADPVYSGGDFVTIGFQQPSQSGRYRIVCHVILADSLGNELYAASIEEVFTVQADTPPATGSISGQISINTGLELGNISLILLNENLIPSSTAESNDDGSFTFSQIEDGEYTLVISAEGYVTGCVNADISNGNALTDVEITLLPGDLNNDGSINMGDFTLMSGSFGLTSADSGFVEVADINIDSSVNVLDLSILGSHFGESSCSLLAQGE